MKEFDDCMLLILVLKRQSEVTSFVCVTYWHSIPYTVDEQ